MFEDLSAIHRKPAVFSVHSTETLWTKPHLARQMLKAHLDQTTPLASRPVAVIDRMVQWLDGRFGLDGMKVCDLGCGPGLYAARYARCGAHVEGLDFSGCSIDYAAQNASAGKGTIAFRKANYLTDPLPSAQDLVTLIYCDFCVLPPSQRATLLGKVRQSLAPGGAFVFDVASMAMFADVTERAVFARGYMDGFWSAGDYFAFHTTWRYEEEAVSLDAFTIIEKESTWQVFNWLQHFSPETVEDELRTHGFAVESIEEALHGGKTDDQSFTVVARLSDR